MLLTLALLGAPAPMHPEDHVLASGSDGVQVVVASTYVSDRPVVRLIGGAGGDLVGSRLHVSPRDPESWLAAEPGLVERDTLFGPRRELELSLAGGGVRRIDLETSRVWFDAAPAAHHSPVVAAHRADEAQALYAEDVRAPQGGVEGQSLEILIEGSMPDPGWSFAGFELSGQRGDDGVRELLATPMGLPPTDGLLRPQMLAPFARTLRLSGLEAGRYRLRVAGRSRELAARPLEIVAADPLLILRRSGGFAGVNESLSLFRDGWIEWSDRLGGPQAGAAPLAPERFERALELLAALPASEHVEQDTTIVDGFEHSLSFPRAGRMWRRSPFGTPEGSPERELVELLSSF